MNTDKKSLARIFWKSRSDAGVSQEYLAHELGVSRKTISNWESGISAPDLWQMSEWFNALGINPMPYVNGFLYPGMENIKGTDSDEEIEKSLCEVIKHLPIQIKRMLLYVLNGTHGSVPYSVLNMIVAHLHCSMFSRVNHGITIYNDYKMHEMINKLVNPDNIKPDMDNFGEAIKKGYNSVVNGKEGYTT